MSKLSNLAAVAYQGGAMGAETISKNGANPKSHTIRAKCLILICFALLTAFNGCGGKEDVNYSQVDEILHGKWEDSDNLEWCCIYRRYVSMVYRGWTKWWTMASNYKRKHRASHIFAHVGNFIYLASI